jgi:hypothetical protein
VSHTFKSQNHSQKQSWKEYSLTAVLYYLCHIKVELNISILLVNLNLLHECWICFYQGPAKVFCLLCHCWDKKRTNYIHTWTRMYFLKYLSSSHHILESLYRKRRALRLISTGNPTVALSRATLFVPFFRRTVVCRLKLVFWWLPWPKPT